MKTKTQAILESQSVWDNSFQGTDKKVLFVCSAGILRSATGARMYAKKYNTRCAGSESYALIPVTADLLLWADEVVFVTADNCKSVSKRFDLDSFNCNVVVLNIPDVYDHNSPGLRLHFQEQYEDY